MEEKTRRGAVLTIFAPLFVLLALSDISKPLSGGRAGLVFFGTKTKGLANAILVWCPVINLHNSCLHMRHHFRLRRDADGGWATQDGAGVER
jgi:hypothetical protein